ncbi:MAG: tRNA (guanosine(37)-N1)-methyltransferase TrmD [Butyricicoccus sp.]
MRIDIMTLFPELIDGVMHESIIGRAQAKGLVEIRATNIRDYALDKHHKADDSPYGGGRGMVMLPEPLYLCHEALTGGEHVHTVMMSAQGAPFTQEKARELLAHERFIIVCGHYEGIDQRFIDTCVDEEISIGDFVLTGGEIPAMAVADAVCRMVPGVLPDETAFQEESHWNGLLEYPQYTHPAEWRGQTVPEVLLSGHHANITRWRRKMSLKRTRRDRPDLFAQFVPQDKQDRKILAEIEAEDAPQETEN